MLSLHKNKFLAFIMQSAFHARSRIAELMMDRLISRSLHE